MATVNLKDIFTPVPEDANYTNKLWIRPNHERREIYYYDENNDKWVFIGAVDKTSYLEIGDTQPTASEIVYWVDTSSEPYVMKVKDANGEWKELSY